MNEQRTILFIMISARSHLYLTFKLASAFKESGYRVVYATTLVNKELILQNGFGFVELQPKNFTNLEDDLSLSRKSLAEFFLTNLFSGKSRYWEKKIQVDEYRRKISKINAELIFLDSYLITDAVFLKHLPCKIISLNILLSSDRDAGIPPINSGYIPVSNRFINSLITAMLWRMYFFKRFLKERLLERIVYWGNDNHTLKTKLLEAEGFFFSEKINKKKYHSGVVDLEEISLAPQIFDFTMRVPPAFHATSMVDLFRKDCYGDAYLFLKEKLHKLKGQKKWPLVYCCLGTLSSYHTRHGLQFFTRLVRAFESIHGLLLISTGNSQNLHGLLSAARTHSNVFVSGNLPQLDVLQYADLMIGHGGINSILECIGREVPMIIYPLNSLYDQKGNAARVVYHGIGFRGDLKRDSTKEMIRKIQAALDNSRLKENIKNFNKKLSYTIEPHTLETIARP